MAADSEVQIGGAVLQNDKNMRILIQRVKHARVLIDDRSVAEIGPGLLSLVGVGRGDGPDDIERMSKKVVNLRIFEDEDGKMNLNVKQVNGCILSVPQFTLYADTQKGNRPGFDSSAEPQLAKEYWKRFNRLLEESGVNVKEGCFGAHMEVELVNDGPVTIWLDSKD